MTALGGRPSVKYADIVRVCAGARFISKSSARAGYEHTYRGLQQRDANKLARSWRLRRNYMYRSP